MVNLDKNQCEASLAFHTSKGLEMKSKWSNFFDPEDLDLNYERTIQQVFEGIKRHLNSYFSKHKKSRSDSRDQLRDDFVNLSGSSRASSEDEDDDVVIVEKNPVTPKTTGKKTKRTLRTPPTPLCALRNGNGQKSIDILTLPRRLLKMIRTRHQSRSKAITTQKKQRRHC